MKNIKSLRIISALLIIFVSFTSMSITIFSQNAKFENNNDTESTTLTEEEIDLNKNLSNEPVAIPIQELFKDETVTKCEYLYNLDESNDFIYVEFANNGYAVFAKETMEMMEYSPFGSLPYYGGNVKKYYAGPINYLQKFGNKFINITNGEQIEVASHEATVISSLVKNQIKSKTEYRTNISNTQLSTELNVLFNNQSQTSNITSNMSSPGINADSLISASMNTGKFIANYRYFLANPTRGENSIGGSYGNNNSGTCGAVAAQLLLSFNNYYNYRKLIDDKYLNGFDDNLNDVADYEKNPNYCDDPMSMTSYTTGTRSEDNGENSYYNKVIDAIMIPYTNFSIIQQIYYGMQDLLNEKLDSDEYFIDYELGTALGLGTIASTAIKSQINSGRPLIICMSELLGGINHFVVAYGYQNYTYPDGSGTYEGYVVDFGWTGGGVKNYTWVNSAWCNGYLSLKINHEHTYVPTGSIGDTGRNRYLCLNCSHRTDGAIVMFESDKYFEVTLNNLSQNGYNYKDIYLNFKTSGYKTIQTFGTKDTVLYLYNSDYERIHYDDDSGYNTNALISFNADANKSYILRVKYYNNSTSGAVKIAVTPALFGATYENIYSQTYVPETLGFNAELNSTFVFTFTPPTTGTYKIQTNYTGNTLIDTCLYVVDPCSTQRSGYYYDNSSAGNYQALLELNLIANRPYLIIVSTYDISTMSGPISVTFTQTP